MNQNQKANCVISILIIISIVILISILTPNSIKIIHEGDSIVTNGTFNWFTDGGTGETYKYNSNGEFVEKVEYTNISTELYSCLNPIYPYATCDEEGCYAYDEDGIYQEVCGEVVSLSTYCESSFGGLIKKCEEI